MSDDVDREIVYDVRQRGEIEHVLGYAVKGSRSPCAVSVASQIDRVNVEMLSQDSRNPIPISRVVESAVYQYQGRLAFLPPVPKMKLQSMRVIVVRDRFQCSNSGGVMIGSRAQMVSVIQARRQAGQATRRPVYRLPILESPISRTTSGLAAHRQDALGLPALPIAKLQVSIGMVINQSFFASSLVARTGSRHYHPDTIRRTEERNETCRHCDCIAATRGIRLSAQSASSAGISPERAKDALRCADQGRNRLRRYGRESG